MPINDKQKTRGTRIILTLFIGFILSTILFRYIIHGIVGTIREPTDAYAITMIVLGTIILIAIGLEIYAAWYDNAIILLVSGVVLICVFVLTLIFGTIRIVKGAAHQTITNSNEWKESEAQSSQKATTKIDIYALTEDVTKLIFELLSILFAIILTFILRTYVNKKKYAQVPTTDTPKK